MMNKILVATKNTGKVAEIEGLIRSLGFTVTSLANLQDAPHVDENADTFEGNARIKAETMCTHFDCPALADDSGLEVDALDGRPGVYSARYGDLGLDDKGRYLHLLKELVTIPETARTARFQCAMVFARPGVESVVFHGTLNGQIALTPNGEHGFGYDPVFIPLGKTETLASLPIEYKKQVSHRAQALAQFVKYLSNQTTQFS